ncbi:MAG: RNA methyltransferase [Gammaproteobacteria bacterium]|nr:RNA methyltransferase [Gammaproteobacteria bacterium]
MALSNIRVVLVRPTHPGNVGAAARALKNMGLRQLVLVAPSGYPHAEARARAAGADDVLDAVRVFATLEQAIAGCRLVVGTSARVRSIAWPSLDPRAAAVQVIEESAQGEVALVFGAERTGLTNEQLDRCHYTVSIPADPEFSSLNLACAVQIMAYEIWYEASRAAANSSGDAAAGPDAQPASSEDLERFYAHLEEVLVQIRFLDPDNPRKLMRRLMRLFNRSRPDSNEMNILRGILTAVQQSLAQTMFDKTRRESQN